jgi:hypothetical protein
MNISILVITTVAFFIGGACGYASYGFLGSIAENTKIKYVAESEIMSLERERLEKENIDPAKKNLFFGDIEKAVELTMKIAASKNDRTTKVIFSISPVFAEDTESISSQVHKEVIATMQNRAEEKNN